MSDERLSFHTRNGHTYVRCAAVGYDKPHISFQRGLWLAEGSCLFDHSRGAEARAFMYAQPGWDSR